MHYPRFCAPTEVAFVLALDVEKAQGGMRIAERHLESGLAQFPRYWKLGVTCVIREHLAERVVVVGGEEARYPKEHISRPHMIAALLKREGVHATALVSKPNTIGNARAIAEWMYESGRFVNDDAIVICAFWHAARVSFDLMAARVHLPVMPAEAVWLAEAKDDASERRRRQRNLIAYWGGSELAKRSAMECNGIADKLTGKYQPLSETASAIAAE